MTWEALSTVASLVSSVVIVGTVIFAARQVTILRAQTDELRRATQLQGMRTAFDRLQSPECRAARTYVRSQLAKDMESPDFDERLKPEAGGEKPWQVLVGTWEELAVFIRLGFLDGAPFYYHFANIIAADYQHAAPLIERQRRVGDNPYLWKDFEWLAHEARAFADRWFAEHPLPRPSTGEPFKSADFN